MPATDRATGVIHDIGYQRYEGPRLGRAYTSRSLFVHSLRGAYGLGRSAWAKVLPIGLISLSCVAALVFVVVNAQLPAPILNYVGVATTFSYPTTVFVAVVAPELVSTDLRGNVLSLYLARPLRRADYALAKLAALLAATFMMYAAPMLMLFFGSAFSTDNGMSGVLDEAGGLAKGLVAAVIHAAVLTALALPFASLTGRRVFATGMIVAVALLTAPISNVLVAFASGDLARLGGLVNPINLLAGIDRWLFNGGRIDIGPYGPVYGLVALALVVAGTACTVWRYRTVKA